MLTPGTDELLVHLGTVARIATNDWARGFARSVLRQARRGGPSWEPSSKQRAIMLRLVSETSTDDGDADLFEDLNDTSDPEARS